MNKLFKYFFSRDTENKNEDYFIPLTKQEQNNPNIKKVYVGKMTIKQVMNTL